MLEWLDRLNRYGVNNSLIGLLFILSLFSIVTQMVGIGVFLPVFEFIFQGVDIENYEIDQDSFLYYINLIIKMFGFNISLESLLITAFIFFMLGQVMTYFIAVMNVYYLGKITRDIRDSFFKYYLYAGADYYDQVKIGDFVNISTTELGAAVTGVLAPIKLMVMVVSAVGSFVVLYVLSAELTLYSLLLILLASLYPMQLIKKTVVAGRKNTAYNNTLVSFLLDKLRSPRLVQLSGTSGAEIKEYSSITEKQRAYTFKIKLLKEKVALVFEPVVIFISLIMLYVSIRYFAMSASAVVVYMIIMVRMVPVIRGILHQKQSINRNLGPIESIDNLLLSMKSTTLPSNDDTTYKLANVKQIELKDIGYKYAGSDNYALEGINLMLDVPDIVAVVGPSGSGKSTLIDVISTYRQPSSGGMLIDGAVYTTDSILDVSQLVSYVPQDPQIFDGSIANHIQYGANNKSQKDIEYAAKLSGSYDYIVKSKDGFNTLVSNNGDNLSGGQRYKLDLARALLSDAPILILDEPTAALDHGSKSDFIIMLNEIKETAQKLIIVITHDFTILPLFEKILLLNQGKLVSCSSHTELLKTNQWYADGVKSYYTGSVLT